MKQSDNPVGSVDREEVRMVREEVEVVVWENMELDSLGTCSDIAESCEIPNIFNLIITKLFI